MSASCTMKTALSTNICRTFGNAGTSQVQLVIWTMYSDMHAAQQAGAAPVVPACIEDIHRLCMRRPATASAWSLSSIASQGA